MVAERIRQMTIQDYTARLTGHLRECNRRYPQAWRQIDQLRANRHELGDWPGWCFCPMSGPYAIVCGQHQVEDLNAYSRTAFYSGDEERDSWAPILDVSRIGALAAWRPSQGIYLIDPTVLESVLDTPVDGTIPVDVLMGFPEWCAYVPTPGYIAEGRDVIGFFAFLEHDTHDGRTELRIQMDIADLPPMASLNPEIIHLHRGLTFAESYERMLSEMKRQARKDGVPMEEYERVAATIGPNANVRIGPLLSVLLYLCSQTAEYRAATERTPGRPSNPSPRKTKEGWRLFPPDRPKIWCVGEAIGKTIREAMARHREHDVDRLGPRPHIRRAHWHSFWSGPKADPAARKLSLKWLPPMPVAMEEDTPEARMRRARTKPIKNLGGEIAATAAELEGRRGDAGQADA
jgi:hypothetical protein